MAVTTAWKSTTASTTDWNTAGNWTNGVPGAGDTAVVPPGDKTIAGYDASANVLAALYVMEGAPAIGDSSNYLITKTNIFTFAGGGTSYINLSSNAVSPVIFTTATPSAGYRGLYLLGSALGTLDIRGGHVGLAWKQSDETASATTIDVAGSNSTFWGGAGVTNTTTNIYGGTNDVRYGISTLNQYGGATVTNGTQTATTINMKGGYFYPNSSGTITNANLYGGLWDETTGTIARSITNLNLYAGHAVRISASVTHSAIGAMEPFSAISSHIDDAGSWVYQATKGF